jgi:hypothetical protein
MSKTNSNDELKRALVAEVSTKYGFEEASDISITSNNSEEIQIKTIRRGVFRLPSGHMGIICKFVDNTVLKPVVRAVMTNRLEVKKKYIGEKYTLCLTDNNIYAYDINYYKTITSMIVEIAYNFPGEYTLSIGVDQTSKMDALLFETEIATFAIAGLIPSNQEEEERVILSNKLEDSQPFFKFKSPIHFNWGDLLGDKDRQFERICELLLQKERNITRIIPIGKTRAADRGRDFEVIEKTEEFNSVTEKKWLVQCKFSETSISPSTIAGWTDRIIEHGYQGFWLMTNNDITPNLFDQFKDVEKNKDYSIEVKFWQRSDFHIKLNVHSELFMNNDIFKSH